MTRLIGGGFAYKTCSCEDFPCCGHNDVDPDWRPDPYDEDPTDQWGWDEAPCLLCGVPTEEVCDCGAVVCGDSCWDVHAEQCETARGM